MFNGILRFISGLVANPYTRRVVAGNQGVGDLTLKPHEIGKLVLVGSPSRLAAEAAQVAISYQGKGEIGGNNRGRWVRLFCGREKVSWCAGFVGYCFATAANRTGIAMPFKRSLGARRLFRNAGKAKAFAKFPRVGDIACWTRGSSSWQGHVGIVIEVWDGGFACVEGNKGKYPSLVGVFRHKLDDKRLLGFARV